ncbi:MAG: ferredoxin--NADP reductase [Candidatus Hodgkinia cicadicola]
MNFGLTKHHALIAIRRVKHYSKGLFSFAMVRPTRLKFKAGEFIMIGLIINRKLIFRPYSICTPSWSSELEFYSIKVPEGALTTFLQKISPRNSILIEMKPTGTLAFTSLLPGERLYLLCTGTGVAPFVSIMFEPEVYGKFKQVIIVLTCRQVIELQYLKDKISELTRIATLKALAKGKVRFYTATTREKSQFMGRIPLLITSGKLTSALGGKALNRKDRFMICGSRPMINDVSSVLTKMGYKEGKATKPKHFVYEEVFVD